MDNPQEYLGLKIYYTGDMANVSGFGKVTAVTKDNTLNIELSDGRCFYNISPSVLTPALGRRFIPRAEYDAQRKADIERILSGQA